MKLTDNQVLLIVIAFLVASIVFFAVVMITHPSHGGGLVNMTRATGNGTEDIPLPGDPGFIPAMVFIFIFIIVLIIVMHYWPRIKKIFHA